MIKTFNELINYFKNPVLEKKTNKSQNQKVQLFFNIFLLCLIIGFLTNPIFILFDNLKLIDIESHKVNDIFKNSPPYKTILLGGFLVPIIEEIIFRAPITLFKNPKKFKIAFYFFTLIFAFIHLTNFEITPYVLLISPILILPQFFTGISLGFLRVKLGLHWSMLLHCLYNTFLLSIGILFN